MGVQISELLAKHEISIDELKGKKLAIDAFNYLYQFLTTIRQRDGTPLMDRKGRITSHLTGLFNRTTKLMEKGIKPIFVFDGVAPKLKYEESKRRKELKMEATLKHKEAVEKKDVDSMAKYASRTSHLTKEMVEEAKELIDALGLPIVQAPSEGEAQAAFIAKQEDAYAIVSQDIDSLLFGAERVVRNLSISGRKKKAGIHGTTTIKPEIMLLSENLNKLGIDQNQLIVLGILVGTDYNIGGVKGIGPKKGLELVKKYATDFDELFNNVDWKFDFPWTEPFYVIKNMPVTKDYILNWKDIDEDKVIEILCNRHNFAEERIKKKIEFFSKEKDKKKQKGLNEWF